MVGMEEIISSRVRAESFTPVMVDPKKTSLVYYGQCVWGVYIDNIQNPNLKISQCCSKPERFPIDSHLGLVQPVWRHAHSLRPPDWPLASSLSRILWHPMHAWLQRTNALNSR